MSTVPSGHARAVAHRAPGALLHIGCGRTPLSGWVNIDIQALPGVDVVADVTKGLNFQDCRAVFAEHFLEHLTIEEALAFLLEVHRVLEPGGWLRLSTPNLDWVLSTLHRPQYSRPGRTRIALALNRSFYGWGHRFLWSQPLLEEALASCGFAELRTCAYGASSLPFFSGLERHGAYPDTPETPHVLIIEAAKGDPEPLRLRALRNLLYEEFLMHVASR